MIPPGLRVLLVEDEAIIALTAEDMIEGLGAEVAASAASLPEALARIGDTAFDVALLDVNLAGEQSLPAAERLRAMGKPFAFTTGYGSRLPGDGMSDVPIVKKPYDEAALAAMIAQLAEVAGTSRD